MCGTKTSNVTASHNKLVRHKFETGQSQKIIGVDKECFLQNMQNKYLCKSMNALCTKW